MNKRWAIALYISFGLLLTLVLTFGKSISNSIMSLITDELGRVEIEDVSVDLEDSYPVGKSVSPKYTAEGRIGSDPCLRFEALDSTLTVNAESGEFKGVRTDDDFSEGRIRISSEADPDFEKIITVRFIKKYPENITAEYVVRSLGTNVSYTRVGVPVIAVLRIATGEVYSESDFEVIFDPEYFEAIDDRTLMPIKATPEGETVSLTFRLGNGSEAVTKSFSVKSSREVTSFDEIRLTNISKRPDGSVKSFYALTLYKDGKRVITDYNVAFGSGLCNVGKSDKIIYNKSGEETLTVTLPNGFSKSITLNIKNVVVAPTIAVSEEQIKLYNKNETALPLVFDAHATYREVTLEYDSEMLSASVKDGILTVTGKKLGRSSLKLIVDDGVSRDERTYTVKTVIDTSLTRIMKNNTSVFVHKVLGHTLGFIAFAAFGLNMFRFFKKRHPVLSFLNYSAGALLVAAVTEYIQSYMPGRTSTLSDVLIDMSGYYIGTLIFYPLFKLFGHTGKSKAQSDAKSQKLGHVSSLKSVKL
ncbi:MAG: VanZ family protein [Clostridia bacterium]|nr:VanZ family protein [Clostridia bacterium]